MVQIPLRLGDLNPTAKRLAQAVEDIENHALPDVPDAGASSAAIAATLAQLATTLSKAAKGCAAAADQVEAGVKAYHSTDNKAADGIHNAARSGGAGSWTPR